MLVIKVINMAIEGSLNRNRNEVDYTFKILFTDFLAMGSCSNFLPPLKKNFNAEYFKYKIQN